MDRCRRPATRRNRRRRNKIDSVIVRTLFATKKKFNWPLILLSETCQADSTTFYLLKCKYGLRERSTKYNPEDICVKPNYIVGNCQSMHSRNKTKIVHLLNFIVQVNFAEKSLHDAKRRRYNLMPFRLMHISSGCSSTSGLPVADCTANKQ